MFVSGIQHVQSDSALQVQNQRRASGHQVREHHEGSSALLQQERDPAVPSQKQVRLRTQRHPVERGRDQGERHQEHQQLGQQLAGQQQSIPYVLRRRRSPPNPNPNPLHTPLPLPLTHTTEKKR